MCKKLILLSIVGIVGFAFLKGSKAFNYAKQEVANVGDWVESQIPTEKKIKHLRNEVKQLDKDINKAQNALVAEIVDVERLTKDVSALKNEVDSEEKKIYAMAEKLKDTTEKVSYGRYSVSLGEAKQLLANDVKRLTARKSTLSSMEQTLNSRERIKDALQKQVEGLRRNKQDLSVAIDKLEAEYKVLQYQQIESKYQVDDTRLAEVKQSLRDLQRDVDIQRQKLKLAPVFAEEGAPSSGLSVDEILAPLSKTSGESAGE